jgi:hypothetical protein
MKIIIFFVSFLIVSCHKEDDLDFFSCSSEGATFACEDCKLIKELQIHFSINKEKSTVLRKDYYQNTLSSSNVYENCHVFDDNNWDCSTRISGSPPSKLVSIMIDGKWKQYLQYFDGREQTAGLCSK